MFAHQYDGNSLSKFSKDAVTGIDMMPDACIRECSLARYSLRTLLVRLIEEEGTYVADSLRHSRWNALERGGAQADCTTNT